MIAHLITMLTHPTFNGVIIGVLAIVCLLCSIPWVPCALAGIMMFDSPGSEKHFIPWAVLLLTLFWCLPLGLGPIMGFVWLYRGDVLMAYTAVIVPIIPFVFLAGYLMADQTRLRRREKHSP
jgi:hypothetical protein